MISRIQHTLRPLLIVLIVVIGASFFFFGNISSYDPMGAPGLRDLGAIQGKAVTAEEFSDARRQVLTLFVLRTGQSPHQGAEFEERLNLETWRQLLLERFAGDLDVSATDQQVAETIRTMLTQNGKFDPARYQQLIEGLRQNFGVTEAQFQEMIRKSLVLDATRSAIVSPVFTDEAEVEKAFAEAYGPVTLQVVRFDEAKYKKQIKVTSAEIEAEYQRDAERNPAYRTPERRKIAYVLFLLDGDQQKLDAKQQEAAREALAQQALDFALALEPAPESATMAPDFKAIAQQKGLTVAETDFFAIDEPAKPLKPSPTLNQAVFGLSKERPTSGNIPLENGFAVVQLVEVQPSQPKPLAEVKKQVEEALAARKTAQAMSEAAAAIRQQLADALAAGEPFEKKAKELGLTVETLPAFVPADPDTMKDPKLASVAGLAFSLEPGELSEWTPAPGGGAIAYMQSRGQPDAEKYGMFKNRIRAQLTRAARTQTMEEWFRLAETKPGTKMPEFLSADADPASAPQ